MDAASNLQWLLNDQPVTTADVQAALKVHAEYSSQDDPTMSVRLNVFKAEDIDTSTNAPVDMTRSLGQAAATYGATSVDGIWTTPDTGGGSFYFYVTVGGQNMDGSGPGALSPLLTVSATITIDTTEGDAAGGTAVRISLTDAYPVASAEIGGVPITEFAVDSNGLAVTGKTGPHDAGAVDVVIKDGNGQVVGTAAGAFTYTGSAAPSGGTDPSGGTTPAAATAAPSNLAWQKDSSAVTEGASGDALTLSWDLAHDDNNQVTVAVYGADQVDSSGALVSGATALDPAPSATEKQDQTGFTADWTVPDSGDGFYFQVSVQGASGDPATALSDKLAVTAKTAGAPSNLAWQKDSSAVTEGASGDALTLSWDLAHDDNNQVTVAVYGADQVDSSGALVSGATALDPAPSATEKQDQTGFTADWTVPDSGDGFYFQVSVQGASGDPATALSDKLAVTAKTAGAPSNLAWQKDSSAVTEGASADALTLSWDLAHDDNNQVTVAVYGADQVDSSGALVSGATALDPAPSATEKQDQTGFTADWTVPDSGDGFYFQVSVQGASGDPATALSDKLAVTAPAAPDKPRFDKPDAQAGDDALTAATPGDKVQVSATYPAHADDVTPTLKLYNAVDVPDPSQIPGDDVTALATIDDAAEADDKLSLKGTWTVATPPAAQDGTASTGVYALVTVGTQSTLSDLLTVNPPPGPSNLRWDTPGADTSSADPLSSAAVGDSVQLSCVYGPRPDGSQPPVVAVFDAKDAGALANATPVATVSITESDDKTGFTATWTVAPPWRKQADAAPATDPGSGDPDASKGTGDQSHDVTASTASVTAILARKPGGGDPASGSGTDPGSGKDPGSGTDPGSGSDPAGGSGNDPASGSSGGSDQILYSVTPNDPMELVGKLDGFSGVPSSSQFEFYAQPPGTGEPDEPPGVVFAVTLGDFPQVVSEPLGITGAGAPPLFSLPGTATPDETVASWTYSPDDPQQAGLQMSVWIVATAETATHTAVLNLAHASMTNLRWAASGSAPTDPPLAALTAGQDVQLRCDVTGYNPSVKPSIDVYNATDVSLPDSQPNKDATALATLEGSVTDGVLSADWTVVGPASPDGSGPVPLPQLVFLVRVGGDQALSGAIPLQPLMRIKLSIGDPNWFMEPIVTHEDDAALQAAAQPAAGGAGSDHHPDRNPDAPADPAAAPPTTFPNRVLGIKQRLQWLGYYYEPLPDSTGPFDANAQTRVFKKCFEWYWKNVQKGDSDDPPRLSDTGEADPLSTALPGAKSIDVGSLTDDWLRKLEDLVWRGSIQQVPDLSSAAGPDVDVRLDAELHLPGDFHINNQEAPDSASLTDPTYRLDYTQLRTDPPYLSLAPRLAITDRAENDTSSDLRAQFERLVFSRNHGLANYPIVATLEVQQPDLSWVPGPDSGVNVLFQLVSAGPADGDPAYLDALKLRTFSRITTTRGAFADPSAPAAGGTDGGPRSYLAQVHQHFKDASPDPSSDPTWWNAPQGQGGKRLGTVGCTGAKDFPTTILAAGANADDLGIKDTLRFPWVVANDVSNSFNNGPGRPGTVSVPVVRGRAGILFLPSRCGGDSYKIRAYIDGAPPAPSANGGGSADDSSADVTTGVLTVWRRVRVTRYFKLPVPDSWKTAESDTSSPDFTAKDLDSPLGTSVSPVDELGGDFTELDDVAWEKVARIYRKAFLILEPPPLPATVLDTTLRKNAIVGAARHIRRLLTQNDAHAPNWRVLLARTGMKSLLAALIKAKASPEPFDPELLVDSISSTPFLINYNAPFDYTGLDPAPSSQWPKPEASSDYPYGNYPFVVEWMNFYMLTIMGMYIDAGFDPDHPEGFDPVPFPGLTMVQSLYGDSLAPVGGPVFEEYARIVGLSTDGKPATDGSVDITDLDAIAAPADGGALSGGIAWLSLEDGDKISIERYRLIHLKTEFAKLPPVAPGAKDLDAQLHDFTPWRAITFTYGEATADGSQGRSLTQLADFVKKNLSALSRDTRTSGGTPDLEFFPFRTIAAVKHGDPPIALWLTFKHIVDFKWKGDGLLLRLVAKRQAADGTSTDLGHFWFDTLGLVGGAGAGSFFSTSGLATSSRTFHVHYGQNIYDNAAFNGPDPSGGQGRGYLAPGELFSYDLPTNVAHEIGHSLYLRHQFTSDFYPRRGLLDHDYDDFCHMSYYTGFVEADDGTLAKSATADDVRAGNGRAQGRAEPCGRCLLKLRGWGMAMDTLPGNVPLTAPTTNAGKAADPSAGQSASDDSPLDEPTDADAVESGASA